MKHIAISSSISNFRTKLLKRYSDYKLWKFAGIFSPTIFFGLYHIGDYLRFVLHRGRRTVFWCGADILALKRSPWQFIIPKFKAHHYCENEVEQDVLSWMGIEAEVHPMIFADPKDYEISFRPSFFPHVFMSLHHGREEEYGLYMLGLASVMVPEVTFHIYGDVYQAPVGHNFVYHGKVSEAQFNDEIKGYHASIRLNTFDGFAETTAKSILLGQYPITSIPYPLIDQAPDEVTLIDKLKALTTKMRPNPSRDYWYTHLCKRIEAH
jgi:hypothetical protein